MSNKMYFAALVFIATFAGMFAYDKLTKKNNGCKDGCCPVPSCEVTPNLGLPPGANMMNCPNCPGGQKQIGLPVDDNMPKPYQPYKAPPAVEQPQAAKPAPSNGPSVWSLTGRLRNQPQQPVQPTQPTQPPCNGPT